MFASPALADLNVVKPWKEEYVYTRAGTSVEVVVHATIQDGYRVVASTAKHPRYLALGLTMEKAQDVEIGAPRYPAAVPAQLGGQKVAAHSELLAIRIPIRISAKAAAGERTLSGLLRYQACNEKDCLPALAIPVEISVMIEAAQKR